MLTACGGADKEEPGTAPTPAPTTISAPATASPGPSVAPTPPEDATAVANRVKTGVASVTKIVTITEDNDPNDKIGRPGGYVSAATLYDSGAECTELGAECGATVEVWADATQAKQRSEFILEALKAANGVLGEEYHYMDGPVLLRVAGAVKPSVAKQYEAAFTG